MVSTNIKYLSTTLGIGRLISIVFGIFSVGLGGHAYDRSLYNIFWRLTKTNSTEFANPVTETLNLNGEIFFLTVVGSLLISSAILLLSHILNEELSQAKLYKYIDIGIHVTGAFLQMLAGSIVIISARNIDYFCQDYRDELDLPIPSDDCQFEAEKIFAGVFAILNFFAFGFTAAVDLLYLNEDKVIRTIN